MVKRFWSFVRNRFIRKKRINATGIVAGSFAGIILLGTLLLMLPISSRSGVGASPLIALFTATSASCVTGLVLVDTWTGWSFFGQLVILGMIQLGGLGFMTVITLFSLAIHRRIGLSERLIMVSTLNLNDMDGVVRVVRHALFGTFALEGAGAVILSARFIPRFGVAGGIWRGIFHSVSAFCNAGFDLLGRDGPFSSLTGYADDAGVLIPIMLLIVTGGLGFFVWEDLFKARFRWKKLSLYSKMVLSLTGALILGGTLFFLWAEGNNPATLGNMAWGERLLNALFQSVTLRTAGFNTVGQGDLREASMAVSALLMLIGGSSGSTAGGLKTVTVGVLLLALRRGLTGREQVCIRGRAISEEKVGNAVTLAMMTLVLFLFGSITISIADGIPYLHAAFETASALGTVGVTTGVTPRLSHLSHLLLIGMMYLGRVGILSVSIAFLTRSRRAAKIKYPTAGIMIG